MNVVKDRGWDRVSLFYSNCQSQIENMVLFSFGGREAGKGSRSQITTGILSDAFGLPTIDIPFVCCVATATAQTSLSVSKHLEHPHHSHLHFSQP